jgi:hypothetical protein
MAPRTFARRVQLREASARRRVLNKVPAVKKRTPMAKQSHAIPAPTRTTAIPSGFGRAPPPRSSDRCAGPITGGSLGGESLSSSARFSSEPAIPFFGSPWSQAPPARGGDDYGRDVVDGTRDWFGPGVQERCGHIEHLRMPPRAPSNSTGRYSHERSRSRRACRRASSVTTLAGRGGAGRAAGRSRWRCMSAPFGSEAVEKLDRAATLNSSLRKR